MKTTERKKEIIALIAMQAEYLSESSLIALSKYADYLRLSAHAREKETSSFARPSFDRVDH